MAESGHDSKSKISRSSDASKEFSQESFKAASKEASKESAKERKKSKSFLEKTWHFLWYEDSILSWIVNIILAFLIIKFLGNHNLILIQNQMEDMELQVI